MGLLVKIRGGSLLEGLCCGVIDSAGLYFAGSLEEDGLFLQGWNNSQVSGAVLASG